MHEQVQRFRLGRRLCVHVTEPTRLMVFVIYFVSQRLDQLYIFFMKPDGNSVISFRQSPVIGAVPDQDFSFQQRLFESGRSLKEEIIGASVVYGKTACLKFFL